MARVAARTLDPAVRVAFFRGLGRSYAVVGTAALLLAYGTGAALLREHAWDLTMSTVVGSRSAWPRRWRREWARRAGRAGCGGAPSNSQVAQSCRRACDVALLRAAALRGLIAVLSLALLALGVWIDA